MTYACHAISAQLLDIPSAEVQQRIIVGHTAAVNAFLYPFEENQRYDPELFLSGGMDFAVLVWVSMLHVFWVSFNFRTLSLAQNCIDFAHKVVQF